MIPPITSLPPHAIPANNGLVCLQADRKDGGGGGGGRSRKDRSRSHHSSSSDNHHDGDMLKKKVGGGGGGVDVGGGMFGGGGGGGLPPLSGPGTMLSPEDAAGGHLPTKLEKQDQVQIKEQEKGMNKVQDKLKGQV